MANYYSLHDAGKKQRAVKQVTAEFSASVSQMLTEACCQLADRFDRENTALQKWCKLQNILHNGMVDNDLIDSSLIRS